MSTGRMYFTTTVALVMRQFLNDPGVPRYGTDLMRATGLRSGSMYPILSRLEKAGWLASTQEDIDPAAAGRPRRRYYQITKAGIKDTQVRVADLSSRLQLPERP